jgi:two-component system cell cycle sensor histidine kinase/response regulator CckA
MIDRKRAEELQRPEQKFKDLIEITTDWVWEVNAQGVYTYASPKVKDLLGYEPAEVLGKTPFDLMPEEEAEKIRKFFNEKIAIKEPFYGLENMNRHKDGHLVVLETNGIPVFDQNGKLTGYRGIDRNITERKHMIEALRESEEKFRAISNTAVDAILVMDNDGKISYWNPAAEKMFGYKSEEATGKELHLFLAPAKYHAAYKKGFSSFKETGQGPAVGATSEFFAIRKDGTEFPIEVSTSAIQIKGKWHAVGIIRDVTERMQAEKALRESEQNYRALFEESKDVIYISTPEDKFLDINPAGIELFGYPSKEELLQINIAKDLYADPGDREMLLQMLANQGYVKDYKVAFKRKDGEQLTVLLTSTAVRDEKGEIIAYRGIIKDITEWQRLERQLLQAQKMEAIGTLTGGIAHDFNNILTAIIGFGTLLQMEMNKDDSMRTYVTPILISAQRAANLTQGLLAFSRRQIISPKSVNLHEIIQGVEKILSRIIGEDIKLSTVFINKDLTVMADTGQIEQVLMNLATNARDAMPDGGSLTIRTEIVKIGYEFIKAHGYGRPGSYALIIVEDTGQGMAENTKERIFEPFYTTKEVGKGTGLGLSMVYGIIKQHDGYINVYSEPGKGTIFKIYLPLIKSKVEEAKAEDYPIIKRGIETVLIAEDDAQVRELIKEVLEGFGYKVVEAEDGEDAIRVFNKNKNRIQLLILDVIMPKRNGKEVYDEIKKVRPDIKTIFTSGYNADIIHKKGILEERLNVISKPITPDELLRKVREVLDK